MSEGVKIKAGDALFWKGMSPNGQSSSIDDWFRSLIYEKGPTYKRTHLYGADAGRCARLNTLYTSQDGSGWSSDAASVAYMKIGDALEGMLAKALEKAGRLGYGNMRLVEMPEVKIGGKIDLLFLDHEDELAIGEVKSCGALPSEPKWRHEVQAQIYAAVSGLDKCDLIYVSRSVQEKWGSPLAMRTFPVDTSAEALRLRLHVAAVSRLCMERGKLPAKSPWFRKSVECQFCHFIPNCWGELPEEPLPLLSPEEAEEVETEAETLVDSMMENRFDRKLETLRALQKVAVCRDTLNPFIKEALRVGS